jgi:hypothetical protein
VVVGLLVVVGDLLVLGDEVLLVGGLGLNLRLVLYEVLHSAGRISFDVLIGFRLCESLLIS